ncbi:MAG: hypothetical protein AAFN77_14745 [Planctomycetota bacterium]
MNRPLLNRPLLLTAIAGASVAIVGLIVYASIMSQGNNDDQTLSKNPDGSNVSDQDSGHQDEELSSEVNEAWMTFTTVAESGDVERLEELSTQSGYESLTDVDAITLVGQQPDQIRFWNITDATFSVSVGPSMKPSGWHFVKERGEWKLDKVYPGR